jgi:hypothetical protein
MWRALGCAMLVVLAGGLGLEAGGGKDKVKDKDKKFEVPKDALAGKVKSVDLKEPSFTLTMKTGKARTFTVNDKTEFFGPKGGDRGTGPAGLKDDCMEKGYEVHVLASKDGKTATEVHLPNRKEEKDKKDKK